MSNVRQKSNDSASFDPWLLWLAFRTHWVWVIPSGSLLATLAALAVWSTFKPVYEATHIMEANRDYVLTQGLSNLSRDLASSERNLITNALVLESVIKNPKLQEAPSLQDPLARERNIRMRLKVGNAGTENMLTISYQDSDPAMAAEVCNAIAASYLDVRHRLDDERFGNVERWLAQPIEIWKRNVEQSQNRLSELNKKSNGYDPFKEISRLDVGVTKAINLRNELASLHVNEVDLQAQLSALQHRDKELSNGTVEPDPVAVENFISADADVIVARSKLAAIKGSIITFEVKEQEKVFSSRYKGLKAMQQETEAELVKLEAAARQRAVEVVSSKQATQLANARKRQLESTEIQLASLRAKIKAQTEEYNQEKSRLEKMGGETTEIQFAKADWERDSQILNTLKQRLETLKAERGKGRSINTMAEAQKPTWPVEEVPFKKIILAGGAAFFFPFGLAILLEFYVKRLTHADNLEANRIAPIVGEIARIPGGTRNSKDQRLFEESVDALRANMLFKLESVRTIVVTSAMPSEGKSSVASQLAISLARASDSSVLIIDADLRNPDQHELFGLEKSPGLCKLLAGKATLSECIDKSLGDLVHVLPAGRLDGNPHNLLTKKNVQQLFSQVKEKYRYVVVDTAPVLPAAESLMVASEGDVTLLCAMRDVSRTDHVKRTQRRLEACGANIVGTVFSGVPSSVYAYRYGDYRYSKDLSESVT